MEGREEFFYIAMFHLEISIITSFLKVTDFNDTIRFLFLKIYPGFQLKTKFVEAVLVTVADELLAWAVAKTQRHLLERNFFVSFRIVLKISDT